MLFSTSGFPPHTIGGDVRAAATADSDGAVPREERAARAVLLLDAMRNSPSIADKQALAAQAGWHAPFCTEGTVALEQRAKVRALVEVGRNLKHVHNLGLARLSRDPDGTLWAGCQAERVALVGEPVAVRAAADGTRRTALDVLNLMAGPVATTGQWRMPCLLQRRATVGSALIATHRELGKLLEAAPRRVRVTESVSGFLPLQGMDLRGAPLPDELMRDVLQDVNLAGEDLSGHRVRGACFRQVDLSSSILPMDLQDAQFIGCDLRGARVACGPGSASSTHAPADTPRAWPDFSSARLRGAVLDVGSFVHKQGGRLAAVADLIDATTPDAQRSLLRSIHSIGDLHVRGAAMESLLSPLRGVLQAHAAGAPAFDALHGRYGSGEPLTRLRATASLAAVLFDPGYAGGAETPGIAWMRAELASELAEHARYYSAALHPDHPQTSNAAALVSLAIHQQTFPAAMRDLALYNNPALAW